MEQTGQYFQYTLGGETHRVSRREVDSIRGRVSPQDTLDIVVGLIGSNKGQDELSQQEQQALTLYHYYASLQHADGEFWDGGGI